MQIATGWLGWSYHDAIRAPMPVIELAFDGKTEMLKACYGSGETPPEPQEPIPAQKAMSIFRLLAKRSK